MRNNCAAMRKHSFTIIPVLMQSLMGETNASMGATGNPSTKLAPQDRAASLFQAPRFIDGVTDN